VRSVGNEITFKCAGDFTPQSKPSTASKPQIVVMPCVGLLRPMQHLGLITRPTQKLHREVATIRGTMDTPVRLHVRHTRVSETLTLPTLATQHALLSLS
jgi:hypothetical protein